MSMNFQIFSDFLLVDRACLIGQNRADILTEAFSSSSRPSSLTQGLALLSIVALAFLISQIAYYWYQHNADRVIDCPKKLYRELVKAHRIPLTHRWTLKQFARTLGLSDPCTLFVEPSHWAAESVDACHLSQSPRTKRKLQALGRILFADSIANPDQTADNHTTS